MSKFEQKNIDFNILQLTIGSSITIFCFSPSYIITGILVFAIAALYGLFKFIQSNWIVSKPNEWLLIIENGLLKKSGVGLKCFKTYNQTAVTFPSTIQGVPFQANQVTKENFGIEVKGIVFWAVSRDGEGPFKCYKYTQGSDANENVKQVTESIVRSYISNTTLMDVLKKRQELRIQINNDLKKQLQGWGIWPETVEITEVNISSRQLFSDMQTEFRFKHKYLASNSKQTSEQVLMEERQKYDKEKQRISNELNTELQQVKYEQDALIAKYEQEYKTKKAENDQLQLNLDQEIEMFRDQRVFELNNLDKNNELEIDKIKNDFNMQEAKLDDEIKDTMNERNFELYQMNKTNDVLDGMYYQLQGTKIKQYVGPEGLTNISGLMPAVNLINNTLKN